VIRDYLKVGVLVGLDPILRGRLILDIVVNFIQRLEPLH